MSRFNNVSQRDRSPARFLDRRPSISYTAPASRTNDNPTQTPLDRVPPRGPKALYDGSPRGRGGSARASFGGRADYRERERDVRPPINADRWDDGRPEWQRRDREFSSGDRGGFAPRGARGYVGRDRSTSPVRVRRGSSEALSTHNTRLDGPPTFYGPSARGGYAGRGGRGDWDRNRGRGSFASERDRDFLPPRSRSREDFAARDRDRGRDLELDRKERSDRWEPDTGRDRDLKPRDHDPWQRDRSTGRQSSGSGPVSAVPLIQGRGEQNPPGAALDSSRRRSTAFAPGAAREWRRDGDNPDYFGRADQPRETPLNRKVSPPPALPSATANALDYGPPPVAKPAELPTEPAATNRDPPPKIEPPAASSNSFLPPTGPKAERPASSLSQAPPLKPSGNEPWTKQELQPRALRPAPAASNHATRPPEQGRTQDQGRDGMDVDWQSQGTVPSGPRASFTGNKPRMLSQQIAGSSLPPSGPLSSTKVSPVDFRPSIPTGPRSERDGLKARPGPPWPTGNATWTSPDYKPKPSIMNNLQSKPPFDGREIHRPPMSAFNHPQKPRFQPPIIPRSRPLQQETIDEVSAHVVVTDDNGRTVKPEEETDSAVDVDMSLNPSSDDEVDEDDLDEEDFAESEEKFRKEMRQLDGMKPPVPLEDPVMVELLLKIQFLGLIVEGVPLQPIEQAIDIPDPCFDNQPLVTGLLSPERCPEEQLVAPVPRRVLGRPLSRLPVNPIPTPPLEDLPFLKKSVPKFELFEESDDEVQHEAIVTAMRTEFEEAAWQLREEVDEIRGFYNEQYPTWKRQVADLDRTKLDAKQPSPRPATPIPPTPIIIAQPPTTERPSRASMRNATEYDLEKVMEESKMMEQERKEAREREAAELEASGARPNFDLEAVVPDMIDPAERGLSAFRDENWKVPPAQALDIFEYIPPVDDFTEEEQVVFTKAFVTQPKRWGRIAESLSRRDYKQCIMHYYLTKNEAAYKETVRLSQPKRRRGRVPAKPRNSALGDLALSYDGGPTAVTDSGRPRRAAAPTFGEAGTDSEAVTPAPTAGKRGARAGGDINAQVGDKPTRTKRVGTGNTKRRTKKMVADSQQQAPAVLQDISGAAVSPQKVQPPTPRTANHRLKEMPAMVEPMQAMEIQTSIEQDAVHAPVYQEVERGSVLGGFPNGSTAPQITSYWSVPEQQKFPDLIAYFGRDFAAIADFMKTKSSTMIKNFYTRELNTGKKELEDAAKRAEGMRDRGEPMGAPPTPVAPPKRRYEATPSMASLPRPMTSLDMAGPDPMHGVVATGTAVVDEFPQNVLQRSARGDPAVKPRSTRDILGPAAHLAELQQRMDDATQPTRSQNLETRPGQGPRPGFFPQERPVIRPANQGLRPNLLEQPAVMPRDGRLQDYQSQFEQSQQQRHSLLQHQGPQAGQEAQNRGPLQSESVRLPFYQTETASQLPPREGLGHVRHEGTGINISQQHERWEREGDSVSFRREPPHRGLQHGHVSSQQSQPSFQTPAEPRREVPRPASTPLTAQAEPPKPAPVKRSNIFSLLDGPAEAAPPKRTSIEDFHSQNVQSPSLSALSHDTIRPRQPPRATTPLAAHGSRSQYLPLVSTRPAQHSADYITQFGGSPAPNPGRDWLSRFDPRPQSGGAEQSPVQVQQPTGQYSNSNLLSTGLSRTSIEIPPRQESSHRSTLTQLQHPGHAASPPPQMPVRIGVATSFRPTPGSSQQQHSRVSSLNFPPPQTQQLPGQTGSAGSTPVSALHPSRGSLNNYEDQRFLPQREHPQMQEIRMREQQTREQEIQARRDFDMRQQQQQQQQDQQYLQVRQKQQQQQRAQEMGQGYRNSGGAPRTFTPPNAQYPAGPTQQQGPVQHPSRYGQYGQGGEERR